MPGCRHHSTSMLTRIENSKAPFAYSNPFSPKMTSPFTSLPPLYPGGIKCNWASIARAMFAVNEGIHSGFKISIIIAWSFHCGPYSETVLSAGTRRTAWKSQLPMSWPAFMHKVNGNLKKNATPIIAIHLLPISIRMSLITLSGFWGRDLGQGWRDGVVATESGALLWGSSCRQPRSMLTVEPRSSQMMAEKAIIKQNMNPGAYCSQQE